MQNINCVYVLPPLEEITFVVIPLTDQPTDFLSHEGAAITLIVHVSPESKFIFKNVWKRPLNCISKQKNLHYHWRL